MTKMIRMLLVLLAFVATELQAQRRPNPAPTRGLLLISYATWDSVRVDVRVGDSPNCDRNPRLGMRYLKKGRIWSIHTNQTICWRREESPSNRFSGIWAPWSRKKIPPGRTERAG